MKLSIAIVRLPNVGKSTLFNALLGRQVADASNYPFAPLTQMLGWLKSPTINYRSWPILLKPPNCPRHCQICGYCRSGQGLPLGKVWVINF